MGRARHDGKCFFPPQGTQGFAEAPASGSLAPLNRLRAFRASARDMASCLRHDVVRSYVTLRAKGAKIFALAPYAFSYPPVRLAALICHYFHRGGRRGTRGLGLLRPQAGDAARSGFALP